MENRFQSLQPSTLQRAFEHHGEFAWPRDDALAVVDALIEQGVTVLGVDVWLPSGQGPIIPSPWIYSWSADSWRRSPDPKATAQDYIKTFQWDPGDLRFAGQDPYFNLTVVA